MHENDTLKLNDIMVDFPVTKMHHYNNMHVLAFPAYHRAESSDESDSAETGSEGESEAQDCKEVRPTDSDLTTTDELGGAVDKQTVMEVSNASNSICAFLRPTSAKHGQSVAVNLALRNGHT